MYFTTRKLAEWDGCPNKGTLNFQKQILFFFPYQHYVIILGLRKCVY